MPIRGVLFDKDGTLIDFQRTWGPATYDLIYTLARGNAMHMAEMARLSHYNIDRRVFAPTSPLIAGSNDDFAYAWADALGVEADQAFFDEIDRLVVRFGRARTAPVTGALPLIEDLCRRDIAVGLATNDSEASARGQLEAMGVQQAFGFVAGYNSGYGAKPDPGMVEAFVGWLGVPAPQIMMVGDSLHDLAAARAAGVVAVGVVTEFASYRDLAPHADLVIGVLGELIYHLDE